MKILKPPVIKPFPCNCCGLMIYAVPNDFKFSECPDLGGWYFDCKGCQTTIVISFRSSRILKEVVAA